MRTVRRVEGDTDWCYVHDDSPDPVCATVSLTGCAHGVPHVLDAWAGTIEPVAKYMFGEDGFTVDLDLAAQGSALVAIGPTESELAASVTGQSLYSRY